MEEPKDYIYIQSDLTDALDAHLEFAKANHNSPVFTVTGLTGSGKSKITESWLKHNKLKYLPISGCWACLEQVEVDCLRAYDFAFKEGVYVMDSEMTKQALSSYKKKVPVLLSSAQIDDIDENTVVWIDDYDRASEEVRLALFDLICNLTVVDPRVDGNTKLKRVRPLMFVVIIDSWGAQKLSEKERQVFHIDIPQ